MNIIQNTCNISKYRSCCCVCNFHVKITKHPWNSANFIKGKTSAFFAYGCAVQFSEYLINKEGSAKPKIIIFDKVHGICELFVSSISLRFPFPTNDF